MKDVEIATPGRSSITHVKIVGKGKNAYLLLAHKDRYVGSISGRATLRRIAKAILDATEQKAGKAP